jgi:hypothetical protein
MTVVVDLLFVPDGATVALAERRNVRDEVV